MCEIRQYIISLYSRYTTYTLYVREQAGWQQPVGYLVIGRLSSHADISPRNIIGVHYFVKYQADRFCYFKWNNLPQMLWWTPHFAFSFWTYHVCKWIKQLHLKFYSAHWNYKTPPTPPHTQSNEIVLYRICKKLHYITSYDTFITVTMVTSLTWQVNWTYSLTESCFITEVLDMYF